MIRKCTDIIIKKKKKEKQNGKLVTYVSNYGLKMENIVDIV